MNHFQRCLGGAALLVLGACSSPTTGGSSSTTTATTPAPTPPPPPTVAAVSAGLLSQSFLLSDHTLWTRGNNGVGQLGVGDTTDRSVPTYVASHVTSISMAPMFQVFLDDTNQLWGCGYSYNGDLGTVHHDGSDPTPFSWDVDVKAVAAGDSHTIYIDSTGVVHSTGSDSNGQLLDGTTKSIGQYENPRTTLTDAIAVAAGTATSFVIKSDHSLWAAGQGFYGQLGTGGTGDLSPPAQVATGVAAVAPGNSAVLYLANDANATLYGAGDNSHHQLTADSTKKQSTWLAIDTHVISMSVGIDFIVWVKDDHTLWGQGGCTNSVLGPVSGDHTTPIQLATGIRQVSANSSYWIAITDDGRALGAGESFGWPPVELAFNR